MDGLAGFLIDQFGQHANERDRRCAGFGGITEQRVKVEQFDPALGPDGGRSGLWNHARPGFRPRQRRLDVQHALNHRPAGEDGRHFRGGEQRLAEICHDGPTPLPCPDLFNNSRSTDSSCAVGGGVSWRSPANFTGHPVRLVISSRVVPGCTDVTINSFVSACGRIRHRSVTTRLGPAVLMPALRRWSPPVPNPNEVTKSTFGTNARGEWETITKTCPQQPAISGAPPPPGKRTFGFA